MLDKTITATTGEFFLVFLAAIIVYDITQWTLGKVFTTKKESEK